MPEVPFLPSEARRLVLALGRDGPLAEPPPSLTGLAGWQGRDVYATTPGWDRHPQASPWPQVGLHWAADDETAARAHRILAAEPGLSAPDAVSEWIEHTRHRAALGQPLPLGGRAYFIVLAKPLAGREDEYDAWYREHHVNDMLNVPGIIACTRFRISGGAEAPKPWHFLSIYEMRTDDAGATVDAEQAYVRQPHIVWTDAKDSQTTRVLIMARTKVPEPIF